MLNPRGGEEDRVAAAMRGQPSAGHVKYRRVSCRNLQVGSELVGSLGMSQKGWGLNTHNGWAGTRYHE